MYHVKISDNTFKVAPAVKDKFSEFTFVNDPGNEVFLVRVYGRTGDSFSSTDTNWDVEVFATEKEAYELALKIDYLQDLFLARENDEWKDWKESVPEERIAQIEDDLNHYDERYPKNKFGCRRFTYIKEGNELDIALYRWNGYFERFYFVRVERLVRNGSKAILRDRRDD